MKVMTVVGTRPEIIKLSRVIPELDKHFEHVLCFTTQNHDERLSDIFFKELSIRDPDCGLGLKAANTPTDFIAGLLERGDTMLRRYNPDALLILGDTNSTLIAYAAKRRHIPVFHMEAGNRCFDQRTPEEINRKIVDHLSDINMVYTEHARRNLLAEGVKPDTIIKTGSPMREVLDYYRSAVQKSDVVERLGLTPQQYLIVSAHRAENVDDNYRFGEFVKMLHNLSEAYPYKVVCPVHPRIREKIKPYTDFMLSKVLFTEPFGFLDYINLQCDAKCVLSDSGTLTEEAGLLGFPAVMLRQSHERPEGMDTSNTIMSDFAHACRAVSMAVGHPAFDTPMDYTPVDVSRRVVRTILSYTGFVNRTVWHK